MLRTTLGGSINFKMGKNPYFYRGSLLVGGEEIIIDMSKLSDRLANSKC